MPTDSSDSPAPAAHTLPPEQRERRARAWARGLLALYIVLGCGGLFIVASEVFPIAFGSDAFLSMIPATNGFLILWASLLLALLTVLVRNRPSWPTALWGVRILMVGVYALFLDAIGVLLLMFLGSVGTVFDADVYTIAAFGALLLGVIFFVTLAVAFFVAMNERRLQQMEEDRATLPRPW
jgi:hypothetical protein